MSDVPPSTLQVESNIAQLSGWAGVVLKPPSASKYAVRMAAVSVLQLGTEAYS